MDYLVLTTSSSLQQVEDLRLHTRVVKMGLQPQLHSTGFFVGGGDVQWGDIPALQAHFLRNNQMKQTLAFPKCKEKGREFVLEE
jgi:hypothetical protein